VAYPYSISKTAVEKKLPSILEEVIQRTQTHLLIGSYLQNKPASGMTTQQEFNSAIFFDTKGNLKEYYNKHVFIPFGEQIPLIGDLKFIQKYFSNTSFFAEGKKYSLFKGPKESNFITVMCFEVLFSSFIRTYLEATKKDHPSYIVNLTNDSWLLNSAGPKHHLFLSKWRALEFNLPIIRANNSGISTIIYPDSSMGPSLPFDQKGVLDIKFKVDKKRSPTLYQKYGHLPFLLFSFLLTLIYLLPSPRKLMTKLFKTSLPE
jgi:apolipoprotein N-acyltransferase